MRRRVFLRLFGWVAASWPDAVLAQQPAKVYRIAVVSPSRQVRDLPGDRSYHAFFQRLREHGYVEGQNLVVERYSAEGRTERFMDLVGEAVRSNPDLIYAEGDRLA